MVSPRHTADSARASDDSLVTVYPHITTRSVCVVHSPDRHYHPNSLTHRADRLRDSWANGLVDTSPY